MVCLPGKDRDSDESPDSSAADAAGVFNGLSRPSMSHSNSLAGKQSMQVSTYFPLAEPRDCLLPAHLSF